MVVANVETDATVGGVGSTDVAEKEPNSKDNEQTFDAAEEDDTYDTDEILVGDDADEALVGDGEEGGEDDGKDEAPEKYNVSPKKASKRKLDATTTLPSRSSSRKGWRSSERADNKLVDVDIVKVFPSLEHGGEVANYTYVHQNGARKERDAV
ncbi:MAG: hypothetical protein SGPRY_007312 [Prymnesium sp.]